MYIDIRNGIQREDLGSDGMEPLCFPYIDIFLPDIFFPSSINTDFSTERGSSIYSEVGGRVWSEYFWRFEDMRFKKIYIFPISYQVYTRMFMYVTR